MMTNRMMDNRIKKLQAIEEQQKELEAQAEAIKAELKAELEANNEDEHNTGSFIIRWKEIISSRLDGKALKAAMPELYNQYSKPTTSRRFTVA
jgi:predicted phage-related endonuclease